jgi:hypothetical protein
VCHLKLAGTTPRRRPIQSTAVRTMCDIVVIDVDIEQENTWVLGFHLTCHTREDLK